jgi:transcriptional regulator with GAF, ATPase, and Fis domain
MVATGGPLSNLGQTARDLSALTAKIASPGGLEEVLNRALEALREVIDYDLAAVFRLDDRELRLIAAAGPLDGPQVRQHRLRLERFPTIRRALATRRPIPLEAHHHGSEGDPYDGVLDLPEGHSCMIVPLFTEDRDLGVITLDRSSCGVYPASAVTLAAVYGQLVSLALLFAQQTSELERYRHRLHERNRRLVLENGGADVAIARLEASTSKAMRRVVQIARQAAASDLPLLVVGETGTGKEVVARALHDSGARAAARSSPSTARRSPPTCSRASCSATSAAPSPTPAATTPG